MAYFLLDLVARLVPTQSRCKNVTRRRSQSTIGLCDMLIEWVAHGRTGYLGVSETVMRKISTDGFEKPKSGSAGPLPLLQWIQINDLVVNPAYKRPITGRGRRKVDRIARGFSWSCFHPIVVAPVGRGKFAIIDGQHRTTAAALVGFATVPCLIVTADQQEQAIAFKAINRTTSSVTRMAVQVAATTTSEPWAVRLVDVCARAEVELLRYPVSLDKQNPGQTMAVGALAQCLKRYGEATLITALQCVTQTTNNRPGTLSARTIKALCAVVGSDPARRDSGLALLEAFDKIDLLALQRASSVDAAARNVSPVQAMTDRIRSELARKLPRKAAAQTTAGASKIEAL